ncbi:NUDIX hydrolase [Nocardioides panacisoli]|uniref:Nudix hydrolase domain-containing protein n=1 Tax=Nocardioides panacisoli TaxID=627624 RepID=A0ABP7HZ78_9ACTN
MPEPDIRHSTVENGVARIVWTPDLTERGWQAAVDVVRREVAAALLEHERVEAKVPADDADAQRIATWSGLRREGVQRGVDGDLVVYARLAHDTPVHEPGGFRALLNSFLPRKRGIGQMLIRDDSADDAGPRVLLCQLTYKADWDLPGGVVEVGESPRLAVAREVEEELGLEIEPGPLLLTDWLPPWGGWDDALCLVFDGGVHPPALVDKIVPQAREIRSAEFCSIDEVEARAADFTFRRVRAALANLGGGPAYTESGR